MSYPKIIPPIETNAPSVSDRHVTQGILDSSNELLRRFSWSSLPVERSVRGGDLPPVLAPISLFVNGFFILGDFHWRAGW